MAKNSKTKLDKQTYIRWYEMMQLIRKFEEKSAQLYGMQKIKGFCHLYNGQEAIVAGTYSVITTEDNIITAYRDHGHALACGLTPNEVMAEMYGKITGCSKGKGGSMHMFSKKFNFYGGHGIVGGQIPMGAGLAFAEKYNGTDKVCVCYMGDGAVRQGALHETFNLAMLWKLPVIFVIENNNYAMGTSVERTTNVLDLEKIGLSYEMPSEAVDGMTCESVHDAMERAVTRARKGDGPTLLNIETYRYRGHSMSDPQKYRTKEEVEAYRLQDPIEKVKATILSNKWMTEAEIDTIDARIKQEVLDSVEFAENSPFPDISEMYKDIYVQADYPFIMD
jgi:pyruvate dehydrogenase E1 component alpha subunit